MAHAKNGWLQYASTGAPWGNNVIFSIKADTTTASNNSQALTPAANPQNYWPLHRSDMRAGYGVDSGNVRDSCIATGLGSPVFTLGGSFSDRSGNTYTVVGLRQERFRVRDLK